MGRVGNSPLYSWNPAINLVSAPLFSGRPGLLVYGGITRVCSGRALQTSVALFMVRNTNFLRAVALQDPL